MAEEEKRDGGKNGPYDNSTLATRRAKPMVELMMGRVPN